MELHWFFDIIFVRCTGTIHPNRMQRYPSSKKLENVMTEAPLGVEPEIQEYSVIFI